ncbi:MAG: ATP-binding protein, partial [Haliea sp.]
PPTNGWQAVTLPDYWQTRWPTHNSVWYRIQWQDECASEQAVALAVQRIYMAGEIYLNDRLLWRDTNLTEPYSRSWNMPRYWLLPDTTDSEQNTLWIRVTGMPYDSLGLGQITLGDPATVLAVHERQRWLQRHALTINVSISFALGILFLALWAVRPTETAFAWFAMATLAWSAFAGTFLATSPWPFDNSSDWNRTVIVIFMIYCCAFCLFIWKFGQQHFRRLSRILPGMTLILAAGIWCVPDHRLPLWLLTLIPGYTLIVMANCAQFQLHAWRTRKRHDVLLALCLLVFLVVGVRDLLVVLTLLPGNHLMFPVTTFVAMLFMFLIIADRFARNFQHIENFNTELQCAVNDTRTEITQTLQRQHELEVSNVRLAERLKLSHDLHDSLGSSLVRSIATVEQSSADLGKNRFLSMLKELRDDLRQIIDSSSQTSGSDNKTPAQWLAPIRQRFVRLFDELNITSQWELPDEWPCPLSSVKRVELTRFIEEALSNAIKHSQADRISLTMHEAREGGLSLHVTDNGIGFDTDSALELGGVGMRSMPARIRKIGGRLDIQSEPGATRVSVYLKS